MSVETTPSAPCAGANLDVVFLLDGSGSMTFEGFMITKDFLASIASQLTIAPNATQVGILQFSDRFSLDIRLSDYPDSATRLSDAIKAIAWHNSGTHIGEGIDYALSWAFSEPAGDRVCSPDVLVVITDGRDQGSRGIPGPVEIAGCRHILTIAVGVGPQVSDAELLQLANNDPTRRFHVSGVGDLASIQRRLCSAIAGETVSPCEEAPCAYGSTCFPDHSYKNFTCVCPPGYTGRNCDLDIDECLSDPCVNGACINNIDHYNCTCDDGYKGINCQYEICAVFPWWLVFLLAGLLILAIMIIIYLCCRKRVKTVEYVQYVKPATNSERTQTDVIKPPSPVYIEVPSTPAPSPGPTWVLPQCQLLFLVDNSGSVGLADYKLVRAFLRKFLDHLVLDSDPKAKKSELSRYGVMVFNVVPKVVIPLTSCIGKDEAKKMDALPQEGHGTRLGAALLSAQEIFKAEMGKKKTASIPKICLVISDGFSEDEVEKGAITLRTLGVIIAVVGVRKINVPTYLSITKTRDLIFQVSSFQDLQEWLRRRIVEELRTALNSRGSISSAASNRKRRRSRRSSSIGPSSILSSVREHSLEDATPSPPSTDSLHPLLSTT